MKIYRVSWTNYAPPAYHISTNHLSFAGTNAAINPASGFLSPHTTTIEKYFATQSLAEAFHSKLIDAGALLQLTVYPVIDVLEVIESWPPTNQKSHVNY